MPLFVISWMDRPDSLETRMGARADHLAHVARHVKQVRLAGPFVDAEGRMIGSMIIFEAEDLAAAEAFHAADPYRLAGLFERSEIKPWRVTMGGLAPLHATGS
jgi:uncharacterized protein YciI